MGPSSGPFSSYPLAMRVIHAASDIADEASGDVAIVQLCDALARAGVAVELATLSASQMQRSKPFVRVLEAQRWGGRLSTSAEMRRWLITEAGAGRVDVIHAHGLWRMHSIYAARAAMHGPRLVTSLHGMLSPLFLAHKWLRKRLFWHLAQRRALDASACLHATSELEAKDIRLLGFKQPICLLPHGVDLPVAQSMRRRRRLLFLGRLHPLKGLDLLLRAWRSVEVEFPEWDVQIVGRGEPECVNQLKALASDLRVSRVAFMDPVFGEAKAKLLAESGVLILPSRSESFGLVVAEALAAGLCVIVTSRSPWGTVESRGVGWTAHPDVSALADRLREVLRKPLPELERMGAAGRDWMRSDFSWSSISARWIDTYGWLGGRAPKPPWVSLE